MKLLTPLAALLLTSLCFNLLDLGPSALPTPVPATTTSRRDNCGQDCAFKQWSARAAPCVAGGKNGPATWYINGTNHWKPRPGNTAALYRYGLRGALKYVPLTGATFVADITNIRCDETKGDCDENFHCDVEKTCSLLISFTLDLKNVTWLFSDETYFEDDSGESLPVDPGGANSVVNLSSSASAPACAYAGPAPDTQATVAISWGSGMGPWHTLCSEDFRCEDCQPN